MLYYSLILVIGI